MNAPWVFWPGGNDALDCPTGRRWSLWQMGNNFFPSALNRLFGNLRNLIAVSADNVRFAEQHGGPNHPHVMNDVGNQEALRQAIQCVGLCVSLAKQHLTEMKSDHIHVAVERLERWMQRPSPEWRELHMRACALRDAAEIELGQYLYYQYPKHKGQKLVTWREDWASAIKAFPEIEKDSFHATDCYAMEHDTASVFHSMRVAEYGLRAIARERGIKLPKDKPIEWATWQEIIREIDKQIAVIAGKPAGAAKDAALAFYSGARADLNGFKDEYRNAVMHVRTDYDDLQALRALQNVCHFMGRLAEKIDHTHKQVDWGF